MSPWSISSALGMTLEGARGQTAAEMGTVLRLPKELRHEGDRPWKLEPYHVGFADLQRRCTGRRDSQKEKATRAKVAELHKELASLNNKLQDKQMKVAEIIEWQNKMVMVAAAINQLQQQVDLSELNVANAIWGEKTYPFEPAFVATVGKYYGSGLLREADFRNQFPAERLMINRWVEDQTKEKIKDLIPQIDPDLARRIRMILVNAIYFKGQWSTPFDKKATKREPFLHADGTKIDASLMHHTLLSGYGAFQGNGTYVPTPHITQFGEPVPKEKTSLDGDSFLMAELPYKGNKLTLVVIAPQSPKGLQALETKLSAEMLGNCLKKLEQRTVKVTLPKFKLETQFELSQTLGNMGMKQAFEPREANFQGMSKSRNPDDYLYISKVLHKAFVDVNEEGTEAAAATAVNMVLNASDRLDQSFIPEFRADRPFLFLIREVDTGAILFLGHMTTPKT